MVIDWYCLYPVVVVDGSRVLVVGTCPEVVPIVLVVFGGLYGWYLMAVAGWYFSMVVVVGGLILYPAIVAAVGSWYLVVFVCGWYGWYPVVAGRWYSKVVVCGSFSVVVVGG